MTYKVVVHRRKTIFSNIKIYCSEEYLNGIKESLEKENFIDFGKIIIPKKDIAYIKVKQISDN